MDIFQVMLCCADLARFASGPTLLAFSELTSTMGSTGDSAPFSWVGRFEEPLAAQFCDVI